MRVLLQNSETKLYFAGPNEWTEDSTKAVDFEHIDRATEVYSNENLTYAEIVLVPEPCTQIQDLLRSAAESALEQDSPSQRFPGNS